MFSFPDGKSIRAMLRSVRSAARFVRERLVQLRDRASAEWACFVEKARLRLGGVANRRSGSLICAPAAWGSRGDDAIVVALVEALGRRQGNDPVEILVPGEAGPWAKAVGTARVHSMGPLLTEGGTRHYKNVFRLFGRFDRVYVIGADVWTATTRREEAAGGYR